MKVPFNFAVLLCVAPAFAQEAGKVGLANPASVFCVENGGQSVIETETDGQRGYCILPDGSKVDEWDHFRKNWDKVSSEQ